ncbi:MAG: M81 family metallopeptidase [Lachnospiraceae bacterium]|nr:M81 family metallopeptidase [Lachnospiraceae bacterium]
MNVLVGGIHQEANTFSGVKTEYKDFKQYRGQELFDCLPQCHLFQEAGIDVIPAVFAAAIPSAPLEQEEFDTFIGDFFLSLEGSPAPDAIYLSLHGAMYIRGLGSGELYFVKKLRQRYGGQIPIFASFDFHGNMYPALAAELNYVTAYKTAPHVDEAATKERAIRALIGCMKAGRYPKVRCMPLPMTLPGEMVITAESPSREILARVAELVREEPVLEASWFCGFIWSDAEEIFMSVAVSAFSFSPELEEQLKQTAAYIWSCRRDFGFSVPALEVPEALHMAFAESKGQNKMFLSDSGDNVTAGAAGDNAYMAGAILAYVKEHPAYADRRVLVTGIADPAAVARCMEAEPGETLSLGIGKSLDRTSRRIEGTFTLIRRGRIPASQSGPEMNYAMVRQGKVDILLNELRFAYTEIRHFRDVEALPEAYHVICIKLGYLYAQLAEIANGAILAFSPGNAPLKPQLIPYSKGRRNFYPLAEVPFDIDGGKTIEKSI